jgi:hypothetical protein
MKHLIKYCSKRELSLILIELLILEKKVGNINFLLYLIDKIIKEFQNQNNIFNDDKFLNLIIKKLKLKDNISMDTDEYFLYLFHYGFKIFKKLINFDINIEKRKTIRICSLLVLRIFKSQFLKILLNDEIFHIIVNFN